MKTMSASPGLFELAPSAAAEAFEEEGLSRRTDFQSRAQRSGADFKEMAENFLTQAGAAILRAGFEIDDIPVDFLVRGENAREILVLARGTPDEHNQSGIRRTDTLEKVGFRIIQLARVQPFPILLVTSDMPSRSSKAGRYLAKLSPDLFDAISVRGDLRGFCRLQDVLRGDPTMGRPQAPWRAEPGSSRQLEFDLPDRESRDTAPQPCR